MQHVTVEVFTPFVSNVKQGERKYRLQYSGERIIEGRNYEECYKKIAKMNAGNAKYKIKR